MKRDHDMDALADALVEAHADRSWLRRLADRALAAVGRRIRRALVMAAPFALFSVAAGVLLARTGVDLGQLLMAMFYGSPVLAVAVVGFIRLAWRQNRGLTYTPPDSDVALAEPGQVGQASPVGQPSQDEVGRVAQPVPPATVTVTVLATPVAALPQAAGQDRPVYYATEPEEEETGA